MGLSDSWIELNDLIVDPSYQRPVNEMKVIEWEFRLSQSASLARRKRREQERIDRDNMLRWVAIAILYIGATALLFGTGWYL